MNNPLGKPPSSWTEADLQGICDRHEPEHGRLDFKREIKVNDRGKLELLKDVAALANAFGGYLILGIDERRDEGSGPVADRLCPIQDPGIPEWAEQVLTSRLSPQARLQFHRIEGDAGFYLVIEVAQSVMKPHSFRNGEENLRTPKRVGTTTTWPDEAELRQMYYESASWRQSLKSRLQDLELEFGDALPAAYLIAMPHHLGLSLIDTLKDDPQDLTSGRSFRAAVGGSNSPLAARADRFEERNTSRDLRTGWTLFQDGVLVHSMEFEPRSGSEVHANSLFTGWRYAVSYFGDFFRTRGYFGDVRIWLWLRNFSDAIPIALPYGRVYDRYHIDRHRILLSRDVPGELLSNNTAVWRDLVRYFFQACGDDVSEPALDELLSTCR